MFGRGFGLDARPSLALEVGVGDEVPVSRRFSTRRRASAVAHADRGRRDAELGACGVHQDVARLGAGEPHRGAALLDRLAAGGLALVGSERGIGVHDLDALQIDVELVGGDLGERGADALPQLDLAGENGDRAVRVDAQPRVEHAVVVEAPGERGGLRLAERQLGGKRKRNDQRAAGLEEIAARERGLHAISFAARCTARTMRLCEAQRHRCPFRACLISRSLGRGLESSSALSAMIMPLLQSPHWQACSSMKARCSGCSFSIVPSPSSVVIWPFAAADTVTEQERTDLPSISTVHAPHWASPQPNFGPFSSRSLRRTYRSGVSGATDDTRRAAPFTRNVKSAMISSGRVLVLGRGKKAYITGAALLVFRAYAPSPTRASAKQTIAQNSGYS